MELMQRQEGVRRRTMRHVVVVMPSAFTLGNLFFGMIRFGSRLDVYLPEGVTPHVAVGQTAIGGETVLADLKVPDVGRGFRAG